LFANAEPGVAAIVEGFGNGVKTNNVLVELGGGIEVDDIEGNVVEGGFGEGLIFFSGFLCAGIAGLYGGDE